MEGEMAYLIYYVLHIYALYKLQSMHTLYLYEKQNLISELYHNQSHWISKDIS